MRAADLYVYFNCNCTCIPNVQLYDDRVGALAVHMRLAQMGVLMDGHKAELMLEVGGRRAFGRQRLWQCAPGRRGQMRSTSCRPRDRGRARQACPRAHAAHVGRLLRVAVQK